MRLFKYDHVSWATNWVFGPKSHMNILVAYFRWHIEHGTIRQREGV
jgi:hypothetical protein